MSLSILDVCNDDKKTYTLLTDLIRLSWSIYNTSLADSKLKKEDIDKHNLLDTDTDTDVSDNDDSTNGGTAEIIHEPTKYSQRAKSDPSNQEEATGFENSDDERDISNDEKEKKCCIEI